jgi:hypothetical protein
MFAPEIRPGVGGYPSPFAESFYHSGGQPYVQSLTQELKRDTIVMVAYFDVIVDVYPGLIPFGVFVRSRRQR